MKDAQAMVGGPERSWSSKPTHYRVFVTPDTDADNDYLIPAYDVSFEEGWVWVTPSDEYAEGDGGRPIGFWYPAHRVVVIEKVKELPF